MYKKMRELWQIKHFKTSLTGTLSKFKYSKIFLKFATKKFIEEKLKTGKINLKATVQNPLQNFLEIIVQSAIKRAKQIVKTNDWK